MAEKLSWIFQEDGVEKDLFEEYDKLKEENKKLKEELNYLYPYWYEDN